MSNNSLVYSLPLAPRHPSAKVSLLKTKPFKAMKKVVWLVVVVIIVLGIFIFGKKDEQQVVEGPIKLGFVGPLTGDVATLGVNAMKAAQLAVDEVNAAGGINGRTVELVVEDGRCAGDVANTAVNKLINVDNVDGIVGGFCSIETSAFTEVVEQAQVPIISPISSAPALTNAGDYVFRVYPSDSFQGVFVADFMKDTLAAQKVAILYTNDEWGTGLHAVFKEHFESRGGEVVLVEPFANTSRDLRTQLAKVKEANADALYFVAYTESSIAGINQIKELGLTIPVFGGDAWSDVSIWEKVGAAGEGFLFSEVFVPNNDVFTAKMTAVDSEPTVGASQAYDAVKIFAQAMAKVGTDGEKVKDALYDAVLTDGFSAPEVSFDENGDLKGAPYVVKVVKDGVAVVRE